MRKKQKGATEVRQRKAGRYRGKREETAWQADKPVAQIKYIFFNESCQ